MSFIERVLLSGSVACLLLMLILVGKLSYLGIFSKTRHIEAVPLINIPPNQSISDIVASSDVALEDSKDSEGSIQFIVGKDGGFSPIVIFEASGNIKVPHPENMDETAKKFLEIVRSQWTGCDFKNKRIQ